MKLCLPRRTRALGAAVATALLLAIATPSAWAAPNIPEFPIALGNAPQGMTLGPDGNVWFVDTAANRIVRVTPDGTMTPYSTGIGSNAGLAGNTAGAPRQNIFRPFNSRREGATNPATPGGTTSARRWGGG